LTVLAAVRWAAGLRRAVALPLLAGLCLYGAGATGFALRRYAGHDQRAYFDYGRQVAALLPSDARALSSASLTYAVPDRTLLTSRLLMAVESEDGRRRYGSDFATLLQRAGITHVVLDDTLERVLRRDPGGRWPALMDSWREVGRITSLYYGGEGLGLVPGTPRTTVVYALR
jgi:hypothetical protein